LPRERKAIDEPLKATFLEKFKEAARPASSDLLTQVREKFPITDRHHSAHEAKREN
jgi:hypothetical protein